MCSGSRSYRCYVVVFSLLVLIAICFYVIERLSPDSQAGLHFVSASDSATGLVVVVHGWIEQASDDWPEDMAEAISQRVDSNDWLCSYFDWSRGAARLNPVEAARYAKDKAGRLLAQDILSLANGFEHIHMIGHSSGCWVISEAARLILAERKINMHLTFLDAFVPPSFDANELGCFDVPAGVEFWADHYFTRDYTLSWTEQTLRCAHNVDLSDIDFFIRDHNFPWKWYYTSITGSYPSIGPFYKADLVVQAKGIEYGFARAKEADMDSWNISLDLEMGNAPVKLIRPRGDGL